MDPKELKELAESTFLTVRAAAAFLNTHTSYVHKLASDGRITRWTIFSRTVFLREDLRVEAQRRDERAERIRRNAAAREQEEAEALTGYWTWNVRTLQGELRHRQSVAPEHRHLLKVRGRKADLIARLEEHDALLQKTLQT